MSLGPAVPGPPVRVLIVDDDVGCLEGLGDYLQLEGFATLRYSGGKQVLGSLDGIEADVAVIDLRMPDVQGLELLAKLRDALGIPVIILTAYGDISTAVGAIRRGAYDFLSKPVNPEGLVTVLRNAVEHDRLRRENEELRRALTDKFGLEGIVGRDPGMVRLFDIIRRVAPTDAPVLVQGETGTGKELVARAVHAASRRFRGRFVAVNCGALSPGLFESEMFGHEKGAFTGAQAVHRGYLEEAEGGTLFLDEVDTLPQELQAKLLRFLEDKAYQRVGSTVTRRADVRVISASNVALAAEVAAGRFRNDLYFRLHGVPVVLPPLRERPSDIPLLAHHFLAGAAAASGRPSPRLSAAALAALTAYHWPGNVRELKNVLEHASLLAAGDVIDRVPISAPAPCPGPADDEPLRPFDEARRQCVTSFERTYLERLLRECQGNVTSAARRSGINYRTLRRRLAALGLKGTEFSKA